MPEAIGCGRLLQGCLLAVVVASLVFVQITGAVAPHWLLPLHLLTLGAPLLAPLRGNVVYRQLWNGGVLAIFAVLVHHASRGGVQHMLEDGLILAAFCQVHLLNNLGPRQKPDLLFFNSFLIALVTSFFCQDVVYAAVFAVYGLIVTFGLQLACASANHACAPAEAREMLRDGAAKAVTALLGTLVVFLVWPRDFQREGLVEDTLGAGMMEVGFSEHVELGRSGRTVASNRVVMRIRLLEGSPSAVPALWRGATFSWYERGRWRPDAVPQRWGGPWRDQPWIEEGPTWTRAGHETVCRVRVEITDPDIDRVLVPLPAHRVDLAGPRGSVVLPRADGTLPCMREVSRGDEPLVYDAELHAAPARFDAAARHPGLHALIARIAVPRGALPESGRALAERIARAHGGAPQSAVVEAMRHELATRFAYLEPGTQGAARDLDAFLAGEAGGHCEFFATALALMLRSQQVPCRLVTGFLCHEWDEAGRVLTVRSRHAHAWVEVLDPAGFWYAADPTPASAGGAASADGALARLGALARSIWAEIAAFDDDARAAAVAWLRALPGELLRRLRTHPWGAFALALAALLAWRGRRALRRRRTPAAVRAWHAALAHAGLRPAPGETPRELVRRARGVVPPTALARLAAAMAAHERARYAAARPGR